MTDSSPGPSAESLQRRVLFRDSVVLVLDKPAGLSIHPGPRTPISLEAFLPALQFGLSAPPHLVHRLDRDTSGCLVLARHRKGLRRLNQAFADGRVEKLYWAVVDGRPPCAAGRIDTPLIKHNDPSGWRMMEAPGGQSAVTDYHVLYASAVGSLLALWPRTGRTHQVRVHCAGIGCPVVGDPVYGQGHGAMLLHARAITIPPLSVNRQAIPVVAPVPEAMAHALHTLGTPMSILRHDAPSATQHTSKSGHTSKPG